MCLALGSLRDCLIRLANLKEGVIPADVGVGVNELVKKLWGKRSQAAVVETTRTIAAVRSRIA
jgi:hypothetical protein